MRYSLDACTLIFLFANNEVVRAKFEEAKNQGQILISPMAYYEVLRGLLARGATTKVSLLKEMYKQSYSLLQIPENEVIERAADIFVELKNKHFTVTGGDLFVAAWSMFANATLVTDNTKDFVNIDGLILENWRH
jgi:tRNA(fMet)-specific endonuclease VapC